MYEMNSLDRRRVNNYRDPVAEQKPVPSVRQEAPPWDRPIGNAYLGALDYLCLSLSLSLSF